LEIKSNGFPLGRFTIKGAIPALLPAKRDVEVAGKPDF